MYIWVLSTFSMHHIGAKLFGSDLLRARKAKLPAPVRNLNAINIPMFCAAVNPTAPMIDTIAHDAMAAFLPHLSITSQLRMTPITAPALGYVLVLYVESRRGLYLKDPSDCAGQALFVRKYTICIPEIHILEE